MTILGYFVMFYTQYAAVAPLRSGLKIRSAHEVEKMIQHGPTNHYLLN